MTTPGKVFIIGDLLLDHQYWLDRFPQPGEEAAILESIRNTGGSAANTAIALAYQGVPCLFCGRIGRDAAGEEIREQLESFQIDTSCIQYGSATGYTITMIDASAERTMFSYRGASAETPELTEEVINGLREAKLLFLSGYFLLDPGQADFVLKAVEIVKRAGGIVAWDPSPLVHAVDKAVLTKLLAEADFTFPNRLELKLLTGEESVEEGLAVLRERTRNIVLKLGGKGSLLTAKTEDGAVEHFAPAPKVDVVDTTGAGDVFNAGFLAAYLKGGSPQEWLAQGNALAAEAITKKGAVTLFVKE